MTQGISSSLNITLARLSSIESNFRALETIAGQNQTAPSEIESDFKKILDKKLEETTAKEEEKTPPLAEIDEEIKPEAKEAINLKSKIDLKAQSANLDEIIETFSDKYGIDGDFIKAIIKQESGFNPKATSKKGAMGLMQLMPKTAQSLGVSDAYNPWENVEGGVKYLKGLLNRFDNDKKMALAAYNAGPNAVKKYGGIPPYKETQNYVNSIMSSYSKIKGAKL